MSNQMLREDAVAFFAEFYGDEHHFPGNLKDWGTGWCMLHHSDLSTYDFDAMTRLVFLAHDRCVRVEVSRCAWRYLRIAIHQRRRGDGRMVEVHPTIDEALASWRGRK